MSTTIAEEQHRNGTDKVAAEVKPMIDRTKDAAGDALRRAEDTVHTAINKGTEQYERAAHTSSKFVRDNPGLAVAGALGVGVLLGLALRNRY